MPLPTVYITLYYGYRHKSKGTSLILVPRKCGVYKLDQESYKMCRVSVNIEVYKMLILTHTEVTNAMSTVYTTLYYGYRHKSKGTNLILVPRKCGVYKLDQESYKMCRVSINIQNAHSHTHRSHQCHAYCLHHSGLWL